MFADLVATDSRFRAVRSKSGATSRSKRVLTLRMLAAQTEWLDGVLRWDGGRVVWTHSRGVLAPSAADLSQAQRALHQVARYPHAGDAAFGDVEAWLRARQANLEDAKRLHLLRAPDGASFANVAEGESTHDLIELLSAEALCANALPVSPSRTLGRAVGSRPEAVARLGAALTEFVADAAAPRGGRALAALLLGAITRGTARSLAGGEEHGEVEAWLARTFRWGRAHGLPDEPGLAVALLRHENGAKLLTRWEVAQSAAEGFALPVEPLRVMLATGAEPERVVALCESMTEPAHLAARLRSDVTGELDELAKRFEIRAERLSTWRDELFQRSRDEIETWTQLAREVAVATGDPGAPRWLCAFVGRVLDLQSEVSDYLIGSSEAARRRRAPRRVLRQEQILGKSGYPFLPRRDAVAASRATELLWEFAIRAVKSGASLPPSLRVAHLQLLSDEGVRLLKPELEWGRSGRTPAERALYLRRKMHHRWGENVQPLAALLKRSANPDVCREAARVGLQNVLSGFRFRDRALYDYTLQLAIFLQWTLDRWEMSRHRAMLQRFGTLAEARAVLGPLLDAMRVLPPGSRAAVFDQLMSEVATTRASVRVTLPRLLPHLRALFAFLTRADRLDDVYEGIEALSGLHSALRATERRTATVADEELEELNDQEPSDELEGEAADDEPGKRAVDVDEWLAWLLNEAEVVHREREAASRARWFPLDLTTQLCALLADRDFARFQAGFRVFARLNFEDRPNLERGLSALHRFPGLRAALNEFAEHPSRALKLLSRLGLAQRLHADALRPLDPWRDELEAVSPDELPASWRTLARTPELATLACDYVRSQRLRAESDAPPASVLKCLELPRKLESELSHLERLLEEGSTRAGLSQRAETLRARLSDFETLERQAAEDARDKLETLARNARLDAVENAVENCFRAQLGALLGRVPPQLALDDNWLNAALLSIDIDRNRKILRRLLRAEARGDKGWRERVPANVAFLRGMQARGVDVEAWKSEHRKRYPCPQLPNGRVHVRAENDPLQVLQMGNAFDTCLSAGEMNAFSTIANACEMNKRVLFARDGKDRIVARKLLCINENGALVGFHTYASGSDEAANTALRAIMGRYAREFAARCNLELADEGKVPTLFAEEWYDDGIVPWADTNAKPPASASASKRDVAASRAIDEARHANPAKRANAKRA